MFKNPLIRSSFAIYVFWWLGASLVLAVTGHTDLRDALVSFAVSLVLTAGGAAVGLFMTLGAEMVLLLAREREVKAGHAHRGAVVSLGRIPGAEGETAPATPATSH